MVAKSLKTKIKEIYIRNIAGIVLVFLLLAFLSNHIFFNIFKQYITVSYLNWLDILSSVVFLFMAFIIKRKKAPQKSIAMVIKDILSGKARTSYDLIGMVLLLGMISGFGNYVFSINNTSDIIYPIIIFINIITFGILYLVFYPYEQPNMLEGIPEKRKVLIMALSYDGGIADYKKDEKFQKIIECIKNERLGKEKLHTPLELPLRSILYHAQDGPLEKVLFLASEKSGGDDHWEKFNELVKTLKELYNLRDDIDIRRIEKNQDSKYVDFNSLKDVKDVMFKVLIDVMSVGYSDKDISINISGGTSLITGIFTILGLEDERQIEYFTQDSNNKPSELKRLELTKRDLTIFSKDNE